MSEKMANIISADDLQCLKKELVHYEAEKEAFFHHVRMTFHQSKRTYLLLRRMVEKRTNQVMNFIQISTPMYWMVYQGLEVKLYRRNGQIVLEWYGEPAVQYA